ncbi:MAG: lysozyme inhibitor LprI family protein [Pseudoxanthomonas sp.]
MLSAIQSTDVAQAVSQPAADESGEDQSGNENGQPLDPSFIRSNSRPSYDACVDRTGGRTWDIQQCISEELTWQDARLNRLYKQALTQRPIQGRDELRNAQRAWLKLTDATCAWDPKTGGQGQMLDAQSCRLNRTINRADELAAMVKTGE